MRLTVAVVLVLLGLAACQSTEDKPDLDAYQQPGRLLEKEIQDRIAAFEFTSGLQLVESQHRLKYIGEPAIPYLLDGTRHKSPLVRGSCCYVLGLIGDIRTIPDLRKVAWNDDVAPVRYEAAAALLECGDNEGFPVLVEGLRSDDIRNRYKCYEILHAVTGFAFGYVHDDEPEKRDAACARWEAWWETKKDKKD